VVAGSATIGGSGSTVTINQGTNAAIINWQTFSIAGGETTKFIVPNSASATLNRVTGGNPSAIYGTLSSNGKLFLVNPSGIIVGPSGRIDTASFLGSTLDVSNDEFLKNGDLHFTGTSDASINNQGAIEATGGDVYLIAKQVDNNGTISAPQGNVGLAAGTDVLFQQAGDQHLFVQATPAGTARASGVTNAGTIRAASAELKAAGGNAYALAINNTGAIAATGYKKVNGQVYLTSDGGNITNSGNISAKTASGNGGTIVLNGHGTSSAGTVLNSGQLVATGKTSGKKGGTVEVLGNQVGITDSGLVDVSGDAGGGTALIGGDEHGANPAIADADQTYLGPDAQITADALLTGNGGKIILWGNQTTQAYGAISAQGGSISGNGGFVETSAPDLDARTVPNLFAAHGTNGTWLLDPTDVIITDNSSTTSNVTTPPAFTLTGTLGGATINQSDLLTALQNGNVVIDATQGTGGTGVIVWQQPNGTALDIASIPGNTLTLDSPVQINLSGIVISNSGSGSLNLVLNSSLSGAGSVLVQSSNIALGGGNFTANGNGYVSTNDNNFDPNGVDVNLSIINAQGGNIMLKGTGGYVNFGGPTLAPGSGVEIQDGSIIETTGSGNIALNGSYSQPGDLDLSFVSGISVNSANGTNIISVGAGTITMTGAVSQTYGSDSFSSEVVAVQMDANNIVEATQTGGSITINGDASAATSFDSGDGSGGVSGVDIGNDNSGTVVAGLDITNFATVSNPPPSPTQISVVGGGTGITIGGLGGTIHTNSTSLTPFSNGNTQGVGIEAGTQVTAAGTAGINIQGTAGSVVVDSGNIESIAAGVSLFNDGKHGSSNTLITTASGNILIQGTGGTAPNLGLGVVIGGIARPGGAGQGQVTIQSTSGNIVISGTGGSGNTGPGSFAGFYIPNSGIGILNNSMISTGGSLTFNGGGNGPGAEGLEIVEITDPNFDTSPMTPTFNSGPLFVNTSGSTGIAIDGIINATTTTFNSPNADILMTGPLTTSMLSITAGGLDTVINSSNNISTLGPVTDTDFFLFNNGPLSVNSTVSVSVTSLIEAFGGDLTLGPNAKIIESGANATFNLVTTQYLINNSSLGANVFQLSNGANYDLYAHDPSFMALGGLTPDFTLFNTTYPGTNLPSGNGLLYSVSGSGPSPNPPPDNGGQNQVLSTITPQNGQIAPQEPPQTGDTGESGTSFWPVSYSGSGMFGQTGGNDLANSSSNGSTVGSGDAAQISHGELNNVTNPAATSALNQALSTFVRNTLSSALSSFVDNDSPSSGKAVTGGDDNGVPDDSKHDKKHAKRQVAQNKETTLDQGEVAVIGGNGVQNIPLSQTPPALQNAMNDAALVGLSGGPGH